MILTKDNYDKSIREVVAKVKNKRRVFLDIMVDSKEKETCPLQRGLYLGMRVLKYRATTKEAGHETFYHIRWA